MTHSSLEKIEGIGPAKAKALLAAMPLGKIRTASVTELAAVKGIGVADAERIAKYFEEKRGKKK
jgi:excinuclease UvrABC nuclease subunit